LRADPHTLPPHALGLHGPGRRQLGPRRGPRRGQRPVWGHPAAPGHRGGVTSYNQFYVDILDYTKEKIKWTGSGSLLIYSSSGTYLTTLTSTRSYTPTANGTYILLMTSNQTSTWDVEVTGQIDSGYGRLWSYYWHINTGSFTDAYSFTGSVYALVYSGSTGDSAVIEMKTDGLSGFDYYILANSVGVTGANGRSVEADSSSSLTYGAPDLPAAPLRRNLQLHLSGDLARGVQRRRGGVLDGLPGLQLTASLFTSSTDGTGHIICDLNGDGDYDLTSDDDLHLVFGVFSGDNNTTWDGTDNAGNDVADGTYNCIGMVTVGEFHYVGLDIETSYSGFRLFTLDASLNRSGLTMYWNDADVQAERRADAQRRLRLRELWRRHQERQATPTPCPRTSTPALGARSRPPPPRATCPKATSPGWTPTPSSTPTSPRCSPSPS
jgi:hypothetical protein